MINRNYNKVYMAGRLCTQVMLSGFSGDICIHLIPQLSIAVNGRFWCAVGLEWLFGTINFGWARRVFVENEQARQKNIREAANKLGITKRQEELRWRGW